MPWNPGVWISQNWLYITGWSVFFLAIWRGHRALSKVEGYWSDLQTVRRDVTVVMTNHLPHVQTELEKVNTNLDGLRGDVKEGLSRISDSLNVVLGRME